MTGVSTDMNFDDVSVKVETVDEEYEYNGSLQPNPSTLTEIKTDPSEPDESYGVLTEPVVPTHSDSGILLGNPVISSPPIMNRAQFVNAGENYTMNAADVPLKKQIAALVKVAAPTTACTTIKQEVDRACHRLSQEGEQSLFLSVNVEKKLCSYVGSDMGRQFLSKRPDIMEHFFQFCQGQSGSSEIAEDISKNLTKPTITDLSQREMPAPPRWNLAPPLKNLTPPRWILEPSNQKSASSNLETAQSNKEAAPLSQKAAPPHRKSAPYHRKSAPSQRKSAPPQQKSAPPPQLQGKRFKEATDEEIQKLFEARQTKSTKKNTTWGCKMFQDWSFERRGDFIDFETITAKELDKLLEKFYCEARPERTGKLYHKNTLINLRAAINRRLADLRRNMDIVKDNDFKPSNGVLLGLVRERERACSPKTDRVKDVITKSDMEKLNTYFENAQYDPIILRHFVYFHIAIHFISRGQEFHEQLKLDSFNFYTDHTGEYATINQEINGKIYESGKRMYATGTLTCPVKLLKLLMDKTDESATALFNKYKIESVAFPSSTTVWYTDSPLKRRTFSNFMKDMSKAAGLSRLYTGHFLRETAIQHLMDEGYEDEHILFMSGFKQMGTLQSYKKKVSTVHKKDMSFSLSKMINPSLDEQSSSQPLDFSKFRDLPVEEEDDDDDDDDNDDDDNGDEQ